MSRGAILQLPTDPVAVQKTNKDAWNELRKRNPNFFTVGYSGRDIETFLEVLQQAGVATVFDVRHTPVSMYKPAFSKRNLAAHLASIGIEYLHMPHLGVPRAVRSMISGGLTREPLWEWYDENVIPGFTLHSFLNWADHPAALLCMELDPTACHRHRLALALERRGMRGYDL